MQTHQPFLAGQAGTLTSQETLEGSLSMGAMVTALPDYRASPQGFGPIQSIQRFPPGVSTTMIQHPQQQQQQVLQFAGQTGLNSPGSNPNFSSQYFPSYSTGSHPTMASPYFVQQHSPTHRSGLPNPLQQTYPNANFFPTHQSPSQQFMFYPSAYGQIPHAQHNFQGLFVPPHSNVEGELTLLQRYKPWA